MTSMCHLRQGFPRSLLLSLKLYLFVKEYLCFRFVSALLILEESSLQATEQNSANILFLCEEYFLKFPRINYYAKPNCMRQGRGITGKEL